MNNTFADISMEETIKIIGEDNVNKIIEEANDFLVNNKGTLETKVLAVLSDDKISWQTRSDFLDIYVVSHLCEYILTHDDRFKKVDNNAN